jgi:hypothetical protein
VIGARGIGGTSEASGTNEAARAREVPAKPGLCCDVKEDEDEDDMGGMDEEEDDDEEDAGSEGGRGPTLNLLLS